MRMILMIENDAKLIVIGSLILPIGVLEKPASTNLLELIVAFLGNLQLSG